MTVTRNISLSALATLLLFAACRNASTKTGASSNAAPSGPVDTLYGIEGAERATMEITPEGEKQLTYQGYRIRIQENSQSPGEKVFVTPRDSGAVTYSIPMEDGAYFCGINRSKAFIDIGTGPSGREVAIFDLQKRMIQFRSTYADTLLISYNGKLWYYFPVDPAQIDSLPDCPQQTEWEASGLGIGWAERRLYDFGNGSLTRKSEYKCVPLQ